MSRLTSSAFALAVTVSLLTLGSHVVAGQGRPSGSSTSLPRTRGATPTFRAHGPVAR